ncbi:hypothetical protein XENOCAPTIV_018661, partial [Xenoophorus captivus]
NSGGDTEGGNVSGLTDGEVKCFAKVFITLIFCHVTTHTFSVFIEILYHRPTQRSLVNKQHHEDQRTKQTGQK